MYTSSWGVMYSIIASLGAGPAFLGALRWGGEAEGLRLGFVFFEGGGGLVDGFDEEEAEVEEGSRAQGSARGMICSDCPAPCCAVLYPAALCWCGVLVLIERVPPSLEEGLCHIIRQRVPCACGIILVLEHICEGPSLTLLVPQGIPHTHNFQFAHFHSSATKVHNLSRRFNIIGLSTQPISGFLILLAG